MLSATMPDKRVYNRGPKNPGGVRNRGPIKVVMPIPALMPMQRRDVITGGNPAVIAKAAQYVMAAKNIMKQVKPASWANDKLQGMSDGAKKKKLWKVANAVTGWTKDHLRWGDEGFMSVKAPARKSRKKTAGAGKKRKTKAKK